MHMPWDRVLTQQTEPVVNKNATHLGRRVRAARHVHMISSRHVASKRCIMSVMRYLCSMQTSTQHPHHDMFLSSTPNSL